MIIPTDVVLIGAGPVGLFAIFQCGMVGLKTHVIDALPLVGGQCAALYPEKPIYDIPAYPKISGQELIENLAQQAAAFDPCYHLNQKVTHIEKLPSNDWEVQTSTGTTLHAKCVLIAAGVGAFGPNRPPLEGIEEYEGTSVHYHIRSPEDFRDKNVVIAGGGDSAVDWAIVLSTIARRVTVVHRRHKFRAAPDSESRLNKLVADGKIDLVVPHQLKALKGSAGALTAVVTQSLTGQEKEIPAHILCPFYGLSMNLGPIAEWGLGLTQNHITVDPATMVTSQAGVYAIGDVASYPHKLKLILTGFSEAAHAAHAMRRYLYPHEVIHFEYSTTKGIPSPAQETLVA